MDKLAFCLTNVNQNDVEFNYGQDDYSATLMQNLEIRIKATGETMTILYDVDYSLIDAVEFADGSYMTHKSGNHLTINLVGSSDKITVNNWYASGDYKIDTIQAGDYAITETQVQLMVQAMATVGSPGGAEGQWTQEQQDTLQPILSTYWQRAA